MKEGDKYMLKIWIQDLRKFYIEPSAMKKWITEERIKRWERLKTKQAKKETLAGEYLLNRAFFELKENGELPKELECISFPLAYKKNDYGAPFLPGNPLHFNWSHSGDFAVLAVSDGPVGIDIQERKNYKISIAKKYYPENVWNIMESLQGEEKDRMFFQCWTLLESWLKARGCGFYGYEKPEILSGFLLDRKGSIEKNAEEKEKSGFSKKGVICGIDGIKWNYEFLRLKQNYEACVVTRVFE